MKNPRGRPTTAGPTPADAPNRTSARGTRRRPSVLARRPEIIPIAATALAWGALVATSPLSSWTSFDGGVADGGAAGQVLGSHAGHGGIFTAAGLTMVGLMTIAMMAPLAIPGARTVAFASARWRAGRAGLWFVAAYLATWTVLAVCLAPIAETLAGVLGSAALAAGILTVACAIAEFDPRHTRWTEACEPPLRLRDGPDANTDCARFGLLTACCGFRLCALPMLAMLAVPSSLPVMALLTALSVADRITLGARRVPIAAAYLLLAGVLLTTV